MRISIHAPREGSDVENTGTEQAAVLFLSTLPARGATWPSPGRPPTSRYFYPRSPRGERPGLAARNSNNGTTFLSTLPARGATAQRGQPGRKKEISIHAPREGSDDVSSIDISILQIISIHAPREGSDLAAMVLSSFYLHFYPRSPRGERPCRSLLFIRDMIFLSTLPARGATPACG